MQNDIMLILPPDPDITAGMQMTEPIPTAPDLQQQVERNYRWNFIVNALDGASWWLGMSFISATVILPLYASHFTQNPLLIGLIPFLSNAGYLLPQLFTANWVERAPRKKVFPVTIGFFLERVPIFLMAPAAYFLAIRQPGLALAAFLGLLAWHCLGAGFVIVGWQDMIAKIIPVDRRGRFFGVTNFIGNGTGILGALAVPFVIERYEFPHGYVLAFAAASVMVLLSWVFLSMAREPAVPSSKRPVSQLEYLRSLPAVLRRDPNFRKYLAASIIFGLSGMATGFLVVYAVQRWHLPDAQASGFTIAQQIGLALANLFFGFLADRKGHKLSLEICALLSLVSLGLAVAAPAPLWFYAIFFLRGAIFAGSFISGTSIIYEFTQAENRPTYIGLANTLAGIAGGIAPILGGWLAEVAGYPVMFVVAAVIGVIAWGLLRFGVREPRKKAAKVVAEGEAAG
jgi:MFS family permease